MGRTQREVTEGARESQELRDEVVGEEMHFWGRRGQGNIKSNVTSQCT